MNISFFAMSPRGSGLIVDNEVVFGLSKNQILNLSESEQDFLNWYKSEHLLEGLAFLHVASSKKSPDLPQEEICKQFMSMLRAKTQPDPDLG